MENKRINIVFCMVVLFFLALTFILIRDLNAKRVNDYQQYVVTISQIVKHKNDKIRELYRLLAAEQKVNADMNNTLAQTRNDLDALTKKLSQPPTPVAAPAVAPAAEPTPAPTAASAAATK